ncbi:MAG: transcription antitermination factor NusB [Pseudomonadota bacterium]
MGKRRIARENALKLLYQIDLKGKNKDKSNEGFWTRIEASEESKEFSRQLVEGVLSNQEKIDEMIASHSTNWKLGRMAYVDRNIMRLAIYELLFCEDIPARVTINEAVDIAKNYGDSQSGSFVNGILDNIAKELGRKT